MNTDLYDPVKCKGDLSVQEYLRQQGQQTEAAARAASHLFASHAHFGFARPDKNNKVQVTEIQTFPVDFEY